MEEKNNNLTIIKKYRRRVWFFISFWFFEVALIIIFRKDLVNFDILLFGFLNIIFANLLIASPMYNFFIKNYVTISRMDQKFLFRRNKKLLLNHAKGDLKEINDWKKVYCYVKVSAFIVFFSSIILGIIIDFN